MMMHARDGGEQQGHEMHGEKGLQIDGVKDAMKCISWPKD
jgi:hypothetical protein